MAKKRIVCIKKAPSHLDPNAHITTVGIGNESGWLEQLSVSDVIRQLQTPWGDRYYVRGSDGSQADVRLGKCAFCVHAHFHSDDSRSFTAGQPSLSTGVRGVSHALRRRPEERKRGKQMAMREFDAHEWRKKPKKVSFKTRDGEKVQFVAKKDTRVPVRVRFKTSERKSR